MKVWLSFNTSGTLPGLTTENILNCLFAEGGDLGATELTKSLPPEFQDQVMELLERLKKNSTNVLIDLKKLVVIFVCLFLSASAIQAQRYRTDLIPLPPPMQFIDRILRPCGSGATPFVSAIAAADGDLDLVTCAGRSITVNGVPLVITPGGGLGDPGGNGYVVRTALNTTVARIFQNGTAITVTNGSGVAGNTSFSLNNTAVTPGGYTYASLTVDAQGRLTSASNGAAPAGGDVVGPASSTDNAAARFNLLTGKLIQDSVFLIDDTGNTTTPGSMTTGNVGGVSGNLALSGATSGTVGVTVASVAGTWTLTLPIDDGTAGQFLQTDGIGVTSWQSVAAGTTINATDNVLPKRLNAGAFTDSRISDNGTDIVVNSGVGEATLGDTGFVGNGVNVSLDDPGNSITLQTNGNGSFAQLIALNGGVGVSLVRLTAQDTVSTLQFTVDGVAQEINAQTNGGVFKAGDTNSLGNDTTITLTDSTQLIHLRAGGGVLIQGPTLEPQAAAITNLGNTGTGWLQLFIDATITAGGTTGNQTINKSAGSVNFTAAASSLVVTSNKVTGNSVVICTVATNDTTLKSVSCVATAGSFTMFANAAATAETRVNFWILNQ